MLMNVLRVALILISVVLIVVCTIISGRNQSNAGASFGGAANDNYFSKNKNASKDVQLNMLMKVFSILLVCLSLVMVVIQ